MLQQVGHTLWQKQCIATNLSPANMAAPIPSYIVKQNNTLPETIMEVEYSLSIEESSLPRGHVVRSRFVGWRVL